MELVHVEHTFPPVFDAHSRILVLGSFPSVKSREQSFYYGHPQNRFWKVVAACTGEEVPDTIEEKRDMLFRRGIAVWDVVKSCDIIGSSDSSIVNVEAHDLSSLLEEGDIQAVFLNGGKAYDLFLKYCADSCVLPYAKLPSTSPANAAWSLERLVEAWKCAIEVYL